MGFTDRDYSRDSDSGPGVEPVRGSWGSFVPTRAVLWLLIATGAGFAVETLAEWIRFGSYAWIAETFGFVPANAIQRLWLWQFATFAFFHFLTWAWPFCLHMLILWMVGPEIERLYGTRRFLVLYFGANAFSCLVCAAIFLAGYRFLPLLGPGPAILALLVVFAIRFPAANILVFFVLPLPARLAVLISIGLTLHAALVTCGSMVATAMLAGALFGLLFDRFHLRIEGRLSLVDRFFAVRAEKALAKRRARRQSLDLDVNRVLEKISRDGIGSLTPEERALLEKASREYRGQDP